MKKMLVSKKLWVIISIVSAVAVFSTCNGKETEIVIANSEGKQFAGLTTCASCHARIYDSFTATAHFRTSQPASKEAIRGSFVKNKNLFSYSYYAKVAMEERDSGLYQVEFDKNFHEKQAYKFDIVIGSGTRGQSYLSWVKKRLIQLPVSYFSSANAWANSPGYTNFQPDFTRTISARCLECHSTYFKTLLPDSFKVQEFDQNQIMYGVQCESCHGPAKQHVLYHQEHQGEASGHFIDNPSRLNRQQKLDLCGYCHGGIRKAERPSFTFSPGDTLLSEPTKINNQGVNIKDVEVHDNQYALLSQSKCFRMSETMTCNTCHNTHQQERGNTALFSKRCMNCHNDEKSNFCKMAPTLGNQIKQNCIDCHMPKKQSKMLTLQLEGNANKTPSTLRSHVIAIYKDETNKYLSAMKL